MSSKILVVDDSPTVQKVVTITLANEGHELFQALNEDELFAKIKTTSFDLILLDFTISQKRSGYETIKQIQASAKETPILLLLGQFDQVDEQVLTDLGIQEKLIKPFDSGRFIQRCRALLDKKGAEIKMEKVEHQEESKPELSLVQAEESWTLNSPTLELETVSKPEAFELPKSMPKDLLKKEIESWGVPVPSVIGNKVETQAELPPVISGEDKKTLSLDREPAIQESEDQQVPLQDDLHYPQSEDLSVSALTEATLSSRMISMSELAPEEDDRSFTDDQTERLDISENMGNLEDEISADNADDFWMADIETSTLATPETQPTHHEVESSPVESVVAHQAPSVSIDKDELIEKVKAQIPTLNEEEILLKLRETLPSIVEQYVKDYCEKTIERVAWEVIPDLAENLIRKELRSIAESVPRNS